LNSTLIAGIANANLVDKAAVETITGQWNFDAQTDVLSGNTFRILDSADSNGISFAATDTTNVSIAAVGTGATINLEGGLSLAIQDSTGSDDVTFSHDGTDFNIVGSTTADINITGITSIQAGTVDADFDAITATSYGGITEANLVDKTAAATISGDWTHTGRLLTDDSTTARAGLNIAEGVAPTSPVDGDVWVTAAGAFNARLNGVTVDLSAGGGSTPDGVLSDLQMSVLSADQTLSNASGVQSWAGGATGQDVFTLTVNRAYRFRGKLWIDCGTTTHTTALAFSLTTAVASFWQYHCLSWSGNDSAATAGQHTTHVSSEASDVINATSTAQNTFIEFEGICRITTGGTVLPQINFSAAPGGTNLMKSGSWISFEDLGADTVTTIGNWA
jgi:hypothetical protein